MGNVTLQTVADKVGVSRMTVSNAFSRPDQLSAALRERILAAADELGYCGPDPAARALARGSAGAVGVLLTEALTYAFTDEVATGFLGAMTQELGSTGLALTLLPTGVTGEAVPGRDVALDGAVVYSCDPDAPALHWLIKRKLPLVYVDQAPVTGVPSVNIDDRPGARAAAEHLVSLGHRRIAVVTVSLTGPFLTSNQPDSAPDHHASRQRMLGWLDALGPAGITPTVVKIEHNLDELARAAAMLLLQGEERPTGVLCFSDVIAHAVVRTAEDLGLDVPRDLSVVGFDDAGFAARMRPALTTVRQPVAEKGRLAAQLLLDVVAAEKQGAKRRARRVVLPTELVVRDTTARPRRGG